MASPNLSMDAAFELAELGVEDLTAADDRLAVLEQDDWLRPHPNPVHSVRGTFYPQTEEEIDPNFHSNCQGNECCQTPKPCGFFEMPSAFGGLQGAEDPDFDYGQLQRLPNLSARAGWQEIFMEKFSPYHLRAKVAAHLLNHKFYLSRPGIEKLRTEVAKFGIPVDCRATRQELVSAMDVIVDKDRSARRSYTPPTAGKIREVVEILYRGDAIEGSKGDKSAGHTYLGRTHKAFFDALGEKAGKSPVDAGVEYFVEFLKDVLENRRSRAKFNAMIYRVQPKTDRYSHEKVIKGDSRSIQAPSIEVKFVWKLLMGSSDDAWHKLPNYRVGEDQDLAVPAERAAIYRKAKRAEAYDVTGYDRGMPRVMMEIFFNYYLRAMCIGIPDAFVQLLRDSTIDTVMVMPDGVTLMKDHGNPSGFPGTLRMNSVLLRLSDLVASARLYNCCASDVETHKYSEYCGDDSLHFILSDRALAVTPEQTIACWHALYDWTVKLEGTHAYKDFDAEATKLPLIVSRGFWVSGGRVYTPILKPDRAVSKLAYNRGTKETGEQLQGTLNSICFLVVEHLEGRAYVPSIDFILNVFDGEHDMEKMLSISYDLGLSKRFAGCALEGSGEYERETEDYILDMLDNKSRREQLDAYNDKARNTDYAMADIDDFYGRAQGDRGTHQADGPLDLSNPVLGSWADEMDLVDPVAPRFVRVRGL